MTDEQQQWVSTMTMGLKNKPHVIPRPPEWWPRRVVYMKIMSKPFDMLMITLIFGNVLLLSTDFQGMEETPYHAIFMTISNTLK